MQDTGLCILEKKGKVPAGTHTVVTKYTGTCPRIPKSVSGLIMHDPLHIDDDKQNHVSPYISLLSMHYWRSFILGSRLLAACFVHKSRGVYCGSLYALRCLRYLRLPEAHMAVLRLYREVMLEIFTIRGGEDIRKVTKNGSRLTDTGWTLGQPNIFIRLGVELCLVRDIVSGMVYSCHGDELFLYCHDMVQIRFDSVGTPVKKPRSCVRRIFRYRDIIVTRSRKVPGQGSVGNPMAIY